MLADRPVGQGSIGEQQRIAVARALVLGAAAAVEAGSLAVISTHDPRLLELATLVLRLGTG